MTPKPLSLYSLLLFAVLLGVFSGCTQKPVRTDAQIATEVQNKIYSDSGIESRQIGVQAASGVVTLSGDVNSETERAAAANDAANVKGVRTVVNNLQVKQAQAVPPAEAPVAKQRQSRRTAHPRKHSRHEAQTTAALHDSVSENQPLQASNTPPPPPLPRESAPVMQAPPAPAPPPPPQKVTVPAGTQLTVRLNDPLDSERNQVGDTFHGSLDSPIVIDGETVIPSGADVSGRVADVRSAGRFAGNSVLTLELTSLSMNGRTYNIQTNQWSRAGKGEGKSTATKIGGGAAVGAILGGIIGGGRGAAIGAAAGAGAGTGVAAAKKGQQIKLGPEAVLNFQIIDPLTVTPQSVNDRDAGRTPVS
jgi:BON domain